MRIYLALKMLLHKNTGAREGEKIIEVRCWGKILGLEKDYTICEAVMEGRQPLPPLRKFENFRCLSAKTMLTRDNSLGILQEIAWSEVLRWRVLVF